MQNYQLGLQQLSRHATVFTRTWACTSSWVLTDKTLIARTVEPACRAGLRYVCTSGYAACCAQQGTVFSAYGSAGFSAYTVQASLLIAVQVSLLIAVQVSLLIAVQASLLIAVQVSLLIAAFGNLTSPGQEVPRQDSGGQASTLLVKFPSDALLAVAPSSHNKAAVHNNTVKHKYQPGCCGS